MRYPLVDGQGNFGSVDGDPPAAMRYTEVRMARIAERAARGHRQGDRRLRAELRRLRCTSRSSCRRSFPNLLVNGSAGIAVGMATNIPPHNLGEVVDALHRADRQSRADGRRADAVHSRARTSRPAASSTARAAIREAYATGRGIVHDARARPTIEDDERSGTRAHHRHRDPVPGEQGAADREDRRAGAREEDRGHLRPARRVRPRRHAHRHRAQEATPMPEVVLNQLYKHTPMQESFGVIMLAIVDGPPEAARRSSEMLQRLHRAPQRGRHARAPLRAAQGRGAAHILEGLKIALDNLDAVIALIRAPRRTRRRRKRRPDEPASGSREIQAQAILDMRLQRLTGLERDKIVEEYDEVAGADRAAASEILGDEREVSKIIVDELARAEEDVRRRAPHRDRRRRRRHHDRGPDRRRGHGRHRSRTPATSSATRSPLYRAQRRGGKGKIGATTKDEDFVEHLFVASTHAYILFFTTSGRVYWLKVHEIPQAGRAARGKAIVNLLSLGADEKVAAVVPVREFERGPLRRDRDHAGHRSRRPRSMAYAQPARRGHHRHRARRGRRADRRARSPTASRRSSWRPREGQAIRFREERGAADGPRRRRRAAASRSTRATRWSRMDDRRARRDAARGHRERLRQAHRRSTSTACRHRGGKGIITIKTTDRTGRSSACAWSRDDDELMLITDARQDRSACRCSDISRDRPQHAGRAPDQPRRGREGGRRRASGRVEDEAPGRDGEPPPEAPAA